MKEKTKKNAEKSLRLADLSVYGRSQLPMSYLVINQARANEKSNKNSNRSSLCTFDCVPSSILSPSLSLELHPGAKKNAMNKRERVWKLKIILDPEEKNKESIIILCLCRQCCRPVAIKLQHCKMLMSCHDNNERQSLWRSDSLVLPIQLLIKGHNRVERNEKGKIADWKPKQITKEKSMANKTKAPKKKDVSKASKITVLPANSR